MANYCELVWWHHVLKDITQSLCLWWKCKTTMVCTLHGNFLLYLSNNVVRGQTRSLSHPRADLIGHSWGGLTPQHSPLAHPTHAPCCLQIAGSAELPSTQTFSSIFSHNSVLKWQEHGYSSLGTFFPSRWNIIEPHVLHRGLMKEVLTFQQDKLTEDIEVY